jgi:hypothetical protein
MGKMRQSRGYGEKWTDCWGMRPIPLKALNQSSLCQQRLRVASSPARHPMALTFSASVVRFVSCLYIRISILAILPKAPLISPRLRNVFFQHFSSNYPSDNALLHFIVPYCRDQVNMVSMNCNTEVFRGMWRRKTTSQMGRAYTAL